MGQSLKVEMSTFRVFGLPVVVPTDQSMTRLFLILQENIVCEKNTKEVQVTNFTAASSWAVCLNFQRLLLYSTTAGIVIIRGLYRRENIIFSYSKPSFHEPKQMAKGGRRLKRHLKRR